LRSPHGSAPAQWSYCSHTDVNDHCKYYFLEIWYRPITRARFHSFTTYGYHCRLYSKCQCFTF
jgi:hypothetical protein